jgi:hypothetical protein
MNPEDVEQERQRLAEKYSTTEDAKLEELAADYTELTDLARKALKDEIERRGLSIVLEDSPPSIELVEYDDLVTLRLFRDLPDAILAKGLLESAGIECFLADDNLVRLDWFVSNAIGNIKLKVKADDLEAATEILDQPALGDTEDELESQ